MDLSGKKPPQYRNVKFEIDKEPVSLQAKSNKKKVLKEFISQKLKGAGYFLTGDVKIDIEWSVHEQKRYETDDSADIDKGRGNFKIYQIRDKPTCLIWHPILKSHRGTKQKIVHMVKFIFSGPLTFI